MPLLPFICSRAFAGLLLGLAAVLPGRAAENLPAASNLLQRVVERAQFVARAGQTNHYAYEKHSLTEELDDKDEVIKSAKKHYQVKLIGGVPFTRLVKVQGRELTAKELEKQNERETAFRQRITRVDLQKKAKRKEGLATFELVDRFDFQVTQREIIEGRPMLVVTFSARAGAPDKSMEDKVFQQVFGTVWVDEEEAEMAKLDARVRGPVSLGLFGAVGSLNKFQATIERSRMLQLFAAQRERDQLLREKMSVLHNMMVADRVVSLGFMAAGMSHHIRNSLVPIKTFIDLVPQQLAEEGIDPATCKSREFWSDYHLSAQQHLDKINSLLKELWVVAETPALGFTDKVHLRDVLTETTMRLRDALAAKNIAVEIAVPDELPVLTVDKAKFLRIFELLIKDEIVSLPPSSRITIRASVDPAEGGRVKVVLQDNGPGLSEETARTIFDPFNTRSTSPSEHGISLMACYFIVHYHGGKIEARSQAGQGTEFHLTFPLSGNLPSVAADNREFFQKIRATDEIWEKLLSTR